MNAGPALGRRRRRRVKSWPVLVFSVLGLAFFIIFMLFPFYWMLVASFKPNGDLYNLKENPLLLTRVTLGHYLFLFQQTDFLRWVVNSILVTVVACGGSLACSIIAGYALARLRFRGAGLLGWAMFVSYLVPPTLLFLPMTAVMSQLHLLNNLWALMLSYPTFLIPFSTWLLMGYFRGIPADLEEAAIVDGCTRIQAMIRVAIPLAIPGILSAGIFAFTLSWNEYLYALTFISSTALKTVPYGVPSELIRNDSYFWGSLMAAALLGSVPVAVLYSFFVDKFVGGMSGAVKG
ncbi:MAG: carbohydrate ABC transporter permease [Candidatus Dormibacteraceae bacterium]